MLLSATLAAMVVVSLGSCAGIIDERANLSAVVDASIQKFDEVGGSETTSTSSGQYALIFDPTAVHGHQVVTVDLADSTSAVFTDTSAIAIASVRTLIDSEPFAEAALTHDRDSFTAVGDGFSVEVGIKEGLVSRLTLAAGGDGGASQVLLITYGITPEARALLELAR